MGHGHEHGHEAGRAVDRSRLRLVLAVTAGVAVLELVGAVVSGSLALLADAGHMFTDTAAIVLALSASYVATLPATPRRTFGYHRAEILAALINAVVLLGVCGYLAVAGVRRLLDPVSVDASQMLVFAVVGLLANLVSVALLATRREQSLNMRGAFLEVLGDAFGSAAAIVAALVVLTTGYDRADSLASLAIAVLILPRAWSLLRDCLHVLLESAPPGLDMEAIRQHLAGAEGVTDVHDCTSGRSRAGCRPSPPTSPSPSRPWRHAVSDGSWTSSVSAWPPTSTSTTPPSRSSRSDTVSTSRVTRTREQPLATGPLT